LTLLSSLKRRFAQNQEDCSFTILALLPTLGDQLFSHMDVEGLTAKLQRGRQSPAGIESKTPKSASIDDSSFAPGDSTMLMDQRDTSQHAMEEIWNKLGTGKEAKEGKDEKDEAGHGINGIPDHEGGQIAKEEVTMNGAAPSGEESPNGAASAHSKIFPAEASNGSGLNAVSEPVPLPISPSARLPASPSSGPAAVSLKQVGNGGVMTENGTAEEMLFPSRPDQRSYRLRSCLPKRSRSCSSGTNSKSLPFHEQLRLSTLLCCYHCRHIFN
jgi:hypothetical protein